jgi:hypothetical protein
LSFLTQLTNSFVRRAKELIKYYSANVSMDVFGRALAGVGRMVFKVLLLLFSEGKEEKNLSHFSVVCFVGLGCTW